MENSKIKWVKNPLIKNSSISLKNLYGNSILL